MIRFRILFINGISKPIIHQTSEYNALVFAWACSGPVEYFIVDTLRVFMTGKRMLIKEKKEEEEEEEEDNEI